MDTRINGTSVASTVDPTLKGLRKVLLGRKETEEVIRRLGKSTGYAMVGLYAAVTGRWPHPGLVNTKVRPWYRKLIIAMILGHTANAAMCAWELYGRDKRSLALERAVREWDEKFGKNGSPETKSANDESRTRDKGPDRTPSPEDGPWMAGPTSCICTLPGPDENQGGDDFDALLSGLVALLASDGPAPKGENLHQDDEES